MVEFGLAACRRFGKTSPNSHTYRIRFTSHSVSILGSVCEQVLLLGEDLSRKMAAKQFEVESNGNSGPGGSVVYILAGEGPIVYDVQCRSGFRSMIDVRFSHMNCRYHGLSEPGSVGRYGDWRMSTRWARSSCGCPL